MKNKILASLLTLGMASLIGACDSDSLTSGHQAVDQGSASLEASARGASAAARPATVPPLREYEVTIENLTGGQPLTPPLVATHHRRADVFDVGEPASFGVKEIAENGNLAPLQAALGSNDRVSQVVVAATAAGPLLPGQAVTFTIEGSPEAKHLSFVSMLICTNDGFTGSDAARLPEQIGRSASMDLNAYDAGTEVNTEDFADMVPPCPVLTGVPSNVPGTGTSDPALAEGGVIRSHPGIAGIEDLVPSIHDWTDPVARITVTRTR